MTKPLGLRYGPLLRERTVHLCVDMQRLFRDTAWRTPWIERVKGPIARLCESDPARTVFTRFIPADSVAASHGAWRRYYAQWSQMTLEELDRSMLDLLPELSRYAPPGMVFDKRVYSPWFDGRLRQCLGDRDVDTLIISGGETDVCVMATVIGAVDHGFRVVVADDALCSSSDAAHDAAIAVFQQRYSQQIECCSTDEIDAAWQR